MTYHKECKNCGTKFIVHAKFTLQRRTNRYCDEKCRIEYFCNKDSDTKCWVWTGHFNMYPRMTYNGTRGASVRRIVWEIYRGDIKPGEIVTFNCGDNHCVNPEHLWTGVKSDSTSFHLAKRSNNEGTLNGNSKFSISDIISIRKDKRTAKEIADTFGVSRDTIYSIKQNRGWKHVHDSDHS